MLQICQAKSPDSEALPKKPITPECFVGLDCLVQLRWREPSRAPNRPSHMRLVGKACGIGDIGQCGVGVLLGNFLKVLKSGVEIQGATCLTASAFQAPFQRAQASTGCAGHGPNHDSLRPIPEPQGILPCSRALPQPVVSQRRTEHLPTDLGLSCRSKFVECQDKAWRHVPEARIPTHSQPSIMENPHADCTDLARRPTGDWTILRTHDHSRRFTPGCWQQVALRHDVQTTMQNTGYGNHWRCRKVVEPVTV